MGAESSVAVDTLVPALLQDNRVLVTGASGGGLDVACGFAAFSAWCWQLPVRKISAAQRNDGLKFERFVAHGLAGIVRPTGEQTRLAVLTA